MRLPTEAGTDQADLPRQMRAGDAAADLAAVEPVTIAARDRALVHTGLAVAIPSGCAGLILPRSGLALHQGVTVLNAPGLIDSGYRGELMVVLYNTTDAPVAIEEGQRIAQLMVIPVPQMRFIAVNQLPDGLDDRGHAGFGSSG